MEVVASDTWRLPSWGGKNPRHSLAEGWATSGPQAACGPSDAMGMIFPPVLVSICQTTTDDEIFSPRTAKEPQVVQLSSAGLWCPNLRIHCDVYSVAQNASPVRKGGRN